MIPFPDVFSNRDTSLDDVNDEGSPSDLVSSGVVSKTNQSSGEGEYSLSTFLSYKDELPPCHDFYKYT